MKFIITIVFGVILLLAYTGNTSLILLIVLALVAERLGSYMATISKG